MSKQVANSIGADFLCINKKPNSEEKLIIDIINDSLEKTTAESLLKEQVVKKGNCITIQDKTFDLTKGKIIVIAFGKASYSMAKAMEDILGADNISQGIAVSNISLAEAKIELKKIKAIQSSHPYPSELSVDASKKVLELASKCKDGDTVFCLISGGGSAILAMPEDNITIEDKIATTKTLVFSGMLAEDFAIIRRHTSKIKGGKLAKALNPARIINLVISDSIYEPFNVSSGPTMPDNKNFSDALKLIKKYDLESKLPPNVVEHIKKNINEKNRNDFETIKSDDIVFKNVHSFLVSNNKSFVSCMNNSAKKKILDNKMNSVEIFTYPQTLEGNVDECADKLINFFQEKIRNSKNGRVIVVAGGEIEIEKKGSGKGGRCQHLSALMIPKLSKTFGTNKKDKILFAAFGTDGNDFTQGVAGGIINSNSVDDLSKNKITLEKIYSLLKDNNSFEIHKTLGTHFLTKRPTQNNVIDAYLLAKLN